MARAERSARAVWWVASFVVVTSAAAATVWVWCSLRAAAPVPAGACLVLDLRHGLAAAPSSALDEIAGEPGLDLWRVRRALERAATDDRVVTVLVRCGAAPGGLGTVQELRASLAEFRRSGKRVIALAESPDTLGYLTASGADEVWLDRGSSVYLTGLNVTVWFLGDLLTRLGVELDLVRSGRFKGIYDQLVAREPSDATREALDGLVDSLFEELVGTIARARGLDELRVRALIDTAVFSPQAAIEAGLVDRTFLPGELPALLARTFGGAPQAVDSTTYLAAVPDTVSDLRVAVVSVRGLLVDDAWDSGPPVGPVTRCGEVVGALHAAAYDSGVEAIVLRVDSPGGTVAASEAVWSAVREAGRRKPVVASLGDTAASGGYYAACAAQAVVAHSGTVTGAIGLVGGKIVWHRALRSQGIGAASLGRGRHAGLLGGGAPWTADERRLLEERVFEEYREFVARVADGRRMAPQRVEAIADGRPWSGRQALERGLVDELGGLEVALAHVRRLLDMPEERPIELVPYPPAPSWWREASRVGARGLRRLDATVGGAEALDLVVDDWQRALRVLDGRRRFALLPLWVDVR